jgi:integrase
MGEINARKLNSTEYLAQATSNFTFRRQTEMWLESLRKRRNNPVEQTTIDTRRYALDKWILPLLGNTYLAELKNPQLKALVDKMAGVLAPSTIRDYTQIVKAVVASAINDDGEEMFPRKWNAEFIDAPPIGKQNQPASDCAGVTDIVFYALGQYRVLYALLAGCGPMRAGEALGLEVGKHISADFRTLYIRQKAKRGEIQPYLKTKNGERDVDLCTPLANMLREFVGDRKSGLLFQTSTGKQLLQANTLQDSLHPILNFIAHDEYGGFNIFRRFRRTHLETARCPEVLRHFWSGHNQTHVSERYIKFLQKREWRLQFADKIGLGFELPGADFGATGRLIEFRKVG